jgi:hypothetical protein
MFEVCVKNHFRKLAQVTINFVGLIMDSENAQAENKHKLIQQ